MDINEINQKILELNIEKNKLEALQEKDKVEYIKSMEWTKECDASFRRGGFAYGSPKYEICVTGPIPELKHTNYIYINSYSLYLKNNFADYSQFNNNFTGFKFHDSKSLIEFIKTVKFRSFYYDKEEFEITKTIKENYQ